LAVRIAHYRYNQALVGPDRDADVVIALEDHLVALDFGIDPRAGLERADDRLREERHEAETDAVLLLEGILAGGAEIHDRGHVDFVDARPHGHGLLRLDQPGGNGLPAAGHADPLLAPI